GRQVGAGGGGRARGGRRPRPGAGVGQQTARRGQQQGGEGGQDRSVGKNTHEACLGCAGRNGFSYSLGRRPHLPTPTIRDCLRGDVGRTVVLTPRVSSTAPTTPWSHGHRGFRTEREVLRWWTGSGCSRARARSCRE